MKHQIFSSSLQQRTARAVCALILGLGILGTTGCFPSIFHGDFYVPQSVASGQPSERYSPNLRFLQRSYEIGDDLQGVSIQSLGGKVFVIGEYRWNGVYLVGILLPFIPTFGLPLRGIAEKPGFRDESDRKITLRVLLTKGLVLDQNSTHLRIPNAKNAELDWASDESYNPNDLGHRVGIGRGEVPNVSHLLRFDARYQDATEFELYLLVRNANGDSEFIRVRFDRSSGYFHQNGFYGDSRGAPG